LRGNERVGHCVGGGGIIKLMDSPTTYIYGPLTKLGLATAAVTCVLDQALKLWLIFVFDLPAKDTVALMPLVSLTMTWNKGISYGWFQQEGPFGQWALLALKAVAVALLWIWLSRAGSRLAALSLGLIIGGAVGNGIDRLAYGAVADFVLLHIETATWNFNWYVFNLADVAIVAGVAGLLYESLLGDRAAKAP
jgi:signal peptidase II